MELRRTVPVKLDVASDDAALLHDTVDEFLFAANYVVDHAWQGEKKTTSKAQLQRETYNLVRAETRLHANLVQNARNKAADAIQSTVARWRQGQYAGKPQFSTATVVYDKRCATFYDDHASISTVEGRIKARYILPDEGRDTPHARYLFNDDYEVTGAELHYRDGDWFLHVRMKADVEPETPEEATTEHSTVLGVDLGVRNLAVASTGTFWTADEFNHWKREYEKRRGSLQRTGTRWAHQNLAAVGRQETGRFEMMLHRVANELVAEARENGCSVIAFEALTGIRERTGASWSHVWAFRRLFDYVEYKAEVAVIAVEQVDPKHTSQRCSTCGFTHSDNRPTQEFFSCLKCGYENHADYNAAKNVGLRYLRRNQTGASGGALVGVALNSGTLNASGEYAPAEESARAGVHAESPPR